VVVSPCAVGSKAGSTTFHIYEESWSHSTLVRQDRKVVEARPIEVVAFGDIVAHAVSLLSPGVRLIAKIDAEGAEYDIILNSAPEAFAPIDELFTEIHAYAANDPNRILNFLRKRGFGGLPESLRSDTHQFIHTSKLSKRAS
jgi:hypothetical protein